MISNRLSFQENWILRFAKSNKFTGNDSSLMKKLVEAVLTVGARLSKINNASLVLQILSVQSDPLTIALHIKLLNVRHKLAQSLAVRQNSSRVVLLNTSPKEPKNA